MRSELRLNHAKEPGHAHQTQIETQKPFYSRVADLHHFDGDPDPDPVFHFNTDRNPAFHFNADMDPDPTPHQK